MNNSKSDSLVQSKPHHNKIFYSDERRPSVTQVIALYENAGLTRPTKNNACIKRMLACANLLITAWDDNKLVGLSRCLTDWVWVCYLADLAVHSDYKEQGIGRRLIVLTKERVGKQSTVLLISVPTAMAFYPKMGFEKLECGFVHWRKA